ncbi:DUF3592 domain-containing protein [Labilibaculum sp.]|uniref:DUF3592 domain-containing protein n=1 Tax=Labilibaculum sp. TaxID=2060723 RepID=UPI0035633F6E
MKISGYKFLFITFLIVLIPIYGNWRLIFYGKKTEGVVVRIIEENASMLLSFYSIISYEADQKQYVLKGPENVEYTIGRKFKILYLPEKPKNAIIYSIKGIYFNRFTPISVALFILWIAFYLSFSPKSTHRKSGKQNNNWNKTLGRKKLL